MTTKCCCESCIDVRQRHPECADIPGHVVSWSDEGTISYIPSDAPVLIDIPRPAPRNWLKTALRE